MRSNLLRNYHGPIFNCYQTSIRLIVNDFLLELASGFSFVGTQVPLEIDSEKFFIDILFYHLKLRHYVVCELKAKKFKPADLGQLRFYLSAVDGHLTHESDNPAIDILLCESRSKIIAEYALKKIKKGEQHDKRAKNSSEY